MRSLRTLFVQHNLVESIKWDTDFHHIAYANLSDNRVKYLELISTNNFTANTILELTSNQIKSINIRLENIQLNDSYTLLLDDNPFDCDLSLHNLLWAEEIWSQLSLVFGRSKCSRPDRIKGRLVQEILRKDLMCTTVNYFSNCTCFFKEVDKKLIVNCSDLSLTIPPDLLLDQITTTPLNISSLELNFSNNFLKTLPDIPDDFKFNVTEISAPNNSIVVMNVRNVRDEVKVLDLRQNKLSGLPQNVIEKMRKMEEVLLGGNHWLCDCSSLEFFKSIKTLKNVIVDYETLVCENLGKRFDDLEPFQVCFNWPVVAAVGIFSGLCGIIIGLFYKFKKDIKIFLYAHNMCLWFVSEEELDKDKIYDAFVCFAADDQLMVEDIIIGLESDSHGFQCLVGCRDWPPGRMFSELVS